MRHQCQRRGLARHARHIERERDGRGRRLPHAEQFRTIVVAAAEHAVVFARKPIGFSEASQLGIGEGSKRHNVDADLHIDTRAKRIELGGTGKRVLLIRPFHRAAQRRTQFCNIELEGFQFVHAQGAGTIRYLHAHTHFLVDRIAI